MSWDSEQLQRLIALKRHEQPPPGYFNHFSREVIIRIKAGETGDSATLSWWSWNGSWVQRAWAVIENRPVVAGAFGLVVCGFFAAGALLSDRVESGVIQADSATLVGNLVANRHAPAQPAPVWESPVIVNLRDSAVVQPIQAASYSLRDEIQRFQRQQSGPQVFPVNYIPQGN